MLKDWSYELEADPLEPDQPASTPVKNTENELISLQEITDQVVSDISKEIDEPKKKKLSFRRPINENEEVNNVYWPTPLFTL